MLAAQNTLHCKRH